MKHLSIVLNIVLILAVGFLYYLHYGEKKTVEKKAVVAAPANAGAPMTRPAIAYVEMDSLYERIGYIKSKKKDIGTRQQAIETEWRNGYQDLENQKNNFLKKGNAITQEEAEQFQNKLLNQQQVIDEKKQRANQDLSEESYQFMDHIQKELKDFLTEYNKQRNYVYIFTAGTGLDYMLYKDSTMDITEDVIEGMNKKIKAAGLR